MGTFDIFLSYNSQDKADVGRIAEELKRRGLRVWLDKWELVPGRSWMEEVQKAIRQARTAAVVIGRHGIGQWERPEISAILSEGVTRKMPVIPILLAGAPELPPFLNEYTWVDFREGISEKELDRFVSGVTGKKAEIPQPPSEPYRCMAPPLEGFIERQELGRAVELLCSAPEEDSAGLGITTALRGAGGFGKTTLAQAIAFDERVRQNFPDGVLWVELGDDLNASKRLMNLNDLLRVWTHGKSPSFETLEGAEAHLREILKDKNVLLVADDVWQRADLEPFRGVGKRASLLVTTRSSGTLPSECHRIEVDAMRDNEAVRLLGSGLPPGNKAPLGSLASRLGNWPLLLELVNRQLQELVREGLDLSAALSEIEEALEHAGLTAFDRTDETARKFAVGKTLEVSLRKLNESDRQRFRDLVVFPEDASIPFWVLERLWSLNLFRVKHLCSHLYEHSLLLHFDRSAETIRIHGVVRQYLLDRASNTLSALHQRLIDTCRPANGQWADLEPGGPYFSQFLVYHIISAGKGSELQGLLSDPHFVNQIRSTDLTSLVPASKKSDGERFNYKLRFLVSHLIETGSLDKLRDLFLKISENQVDNQRQLGFAET